MPVFVGGELFDDFWVVSDGGVFGEGLADVPVFVPRQLPHPLGFATKRRVLR